MTELIGTKFDLVVVGTGAAATTVASKCASAGWKVAIADSRPFGGTCALRGCDPKKVLVGAAEVMDWVQRMKGKGSRASRLGLIGRNSSASSDLSLIQYQRIVRQISPKRALRPSMIALTLWAQRQFRSVETFWKDATSSSPPEPHRGNWTSQVKSF